MSALAIRSTIREPSLEAFFLGTVPYEACLALQQRLVYESTGRRDGQVALLIAEHEPLVTIGRQGSRAHIQVSDDELRRRGLTLRWINRGGGCLWHGPGQLSISPIVPLEFYGLTVGGYLDLFLDALANTLDEFQLGGLERRGRRGLWARSGQLVAVGAAVKHATTYHGAVVNVSSPTYAWHGIVSDPEQGSRMSSLVAERRQPTRITQVRTSIVRHLAAALDIARVHVYTGHPLLRSVRPAPQTPVAHAG